MERFLKNHKTILPILPSYQKVYLNRIKANYCYNGFGNIGKMHLTNVLIHIAIMATCCLVKSVFRAIKSSFWQLGRMVR